MCVIDKMSFDEDDISWLTQRPTLENGLANFNIQPHFIEEEIDVNDTVSLKESLSIQNKRILYDNVEAEDISSDDNIDTM